MKEWRKWMIFNKLNQSNEFNLSSYALRSRYDQ